MITREQVKNLQAGDVVEMQGPGGLSVRGQLTTYGEGSLVFGPNVNTGAWTVRTRLGDPGGLFADWDITEVVRAPRPLYVNYPRTEPVPGDVVRQASGPPHSWGHTWHYLGNAEGLNRWWRFDDRSVPFNKDAGLVLLVDGETGQVVQ